MNWIITLCFHMFFQASHEMHNWARAFYSNTFCTSKMYAELLSQKCTSHCSHCMWMQKNWKQGIYCPFLPHEITGWDIHSLLYEYKWCFCNSLFTDRKLTNSPSTVFLLVLFCPVLVGACIYMKSECNFTLSFICKICSSSN